MRRLARNNAQTGSSSVPSWQVQHLRIVCAISRSERMNEPRHSKRDGISSPGPHNRTSGYFRPGSMPYAFIRGIFGFSARDVGD